MNLVNNTSPNFGKVTTDMQADMMLICKMKSDKKWNKYYDLVDKQRNNTNADIFISGQHSLTKLKAAVIPTGLKEVEIHEQKPFESTLKFIKRICDRADNI